jgi:uncharacterized protein (TIGR00255 family)
MIRSMTGYGSAKGSAAGFEVSIEIKSVNNRNLETSVRLPRSFLFAESAVKNTVAGHISRGKVDVFISVSPGEADDVRVSVNESLLKGYLNALRDISEKYELPYHLTTLDAAKFPDVLTVERAEMDAEAVSAALSALTEEALRDFDDMRTREGLQLQNDVLSRLSRINELVTSIEEEAPHTAERYYQRLSQKMKDILGTAGVAEERILAEAAVFADHIAVDEETVRLRSHMSQLEGMVRGGSPIGKKMDFLMQEFNREANTIGSKCQNSDIAHTVVDLKAEIEKIREQVQNIE